MGVDGGWMEDGWMEENMINTLIFYATFIKSGSS